MKKQFIKITAISLLALIIPMTGGLCFQDLLGVSFSSNVAQAATSISDSPELGMSMDVCNRSGVNQLNYQTNTFTSRVNKVDNGQNLRTATSAPISDDDNSLLPCCVGGAHPNSIISFNSLEIHKPIHFAIFSFEKLPLNTLQTISYQVPLKAPPELSSLKTTVLRI